MKLRGICLDISICQLGTHCRRLPRVLPSSFWNWQSTIWPTPVLWFIISVNTRVSTTWCWDISAIVFYPLRNFPRSCCQTRKFNLDLYSQRPLALYQFTTIGTSGIGICREIEGNLHRKCQGVMFYDNTRRERDFDRWLYLEILNLVLIIGI
jgi:hypothetical protein